MLASIQRFSHRLLPGAPFILSPILLLLILLTFLPLLFQSKLPAISIDYYLPMHTALEIIAITISALIFAVIREQAQYELSWRGLVLAAAFFAVFWLDLAHILSFQGMAPYFGDNTPAKTINFWLMVFCLLVVK